MTIDVLVDTNIYIGDAIRFTDVTNYGTPIVMTDVNGTRFKFASVLSSNQIATGVTNLVMGVEYTLVGTGSIVVDTKTFNAGDTFILETNASPSIPSTLSVNETGYYSPVSGYVPTDGAVSFTPTQLGQSGLTVADTIFNFTYEIYTTKHSVGSVTVSSSTQFIVTGSNGGYITISGVVYRVGEVFTKSSTFTFANTSGTNYVCNYYGSATMYFMSYYNAYNVYSNYINSVSQDNSLDMTLYSNFVKVHTLLNANLINIEKSISVDITAMQNNLDEINSIYSQQINNI
jgi:hypothetical protein